jgi:two-component sensor histidine kinase/branched-subunit amino acid transport protein
MQLAQNLSAGAVAPNSKRKPLGDRSFSPWLLRLVTSIPPYSKRAMGVAVLCFMCALAVQIIFRQMGGSLLFATYYPAVLVAGLLAGLPAGIFVAIATLGTVWLVFIPPAFVFNPLTFNQQLDFATFLVSSACIIAVTENYRAALRQLRRHEQERELVMKELEHRGRNTYAVIDVIVQKTLEDQPERAAVISGRIRAIKYANDLLTQAPTHTVLLKSLLLHEFVPYDDARFRTDGPDIELPPDTARHLALVFHELVTNAAKYGALSKSGGRVLISWKHLDGVVSLEWSEEGGAVVSPPRKSGFGSKIVTQSLKALSGSITPTFAPGGLHCSITFRA